jgi:hypothetical protein
MPGLARAIFNRMFVPTVIGGMWAYAHFNGVDARTLRTTWRDANNVEHCANPYTAPVPRHNAPPADEVIEDDGENTLVGFAPAMRPPAIAHVDQ